VNDEVSVAELLEREGWTEDDPSPKGRMQVVAVMLAVILGCGLAALLVHFGSQDPQADSPSVFDVPHGPTGGLAGGGVPPSPDETEVTDSSTHIVVTNEAAPGNNAVPWHPRQHARDTQTATGTKSSTTASSTTGTDTPTTTADSSQPGGGGGKPSSPTKNPPSPTTSRCLLFLCL
jgi:hypothetical protein